MKTITLIFLATIPGVALCQQPGDAPAPEVINKKLDTLARKIKLLESEKKLAELNLQISEIQEKMPKAKPTRKKVAKTTHTPIKLKSLFRQGAEWGGVFDFRGSRARGVPGDIIFGRYQITAISPSGAVVVDNITSRKYRVRP